MSRSDAAVLAIVLMSFALGIYLYPSMPDTMASHWNAAGEVDGYMSKFWGVFFMPILSAGLYLLFLAVPKIDPMKANIEKFRKYYDGFVVLIIAFLFYIYLLTVYWNLGARLNMTLAVLPATGVLFYYAGILIKHAKRNWFIGIRTPWTLSSDSVWDKTHKLGGKLFKIAGVLALLGIFFGKYAVWLVLAPVLLFSAYLFVYSYLEWKKEKK